MSLVLNALPDPHAQLRSLQATLQKKQERIDELELELKRERMKSAGITMAAEELRTVLSPLYQALQMVFGHIADMGVTSTGTTATSGSKQQVWEDWKQKLGGAAAKIIGFLQLHGELNQNQLRIHLGTSRMQTVYDAVSKLNKAGIINKNGGRISLKEL